MAGIQTPRRRRWANIAVAFAAAYSIAAGVWLPPELWSGGENTAVDSQIGIGVTYAIAGVLGFVAIFVATRWPRVGQALVLAAAVVMLLSFVTLTRATGVAILSIGGTAALFLLAVPFMGAMPTPEEER